MPAARATAPLTPAPRATVPFAAASAAASSASILIPPARLPAIPGAPVPTPPTSIRPLMRWWWGGWWRDFSRDTNVARSLREREASSRREPATKIGERRRDRGPMLHRIQIDGISRDGQSFRDLFNLLSGYC